MTRTRPRPVLAVLLTMAAIGCGSAGCDTAPDLSVPHQDRWGIYRLDLATSEVELILGSSDRITALHLSPDGSRLALSQRLDGDTLQHEEIASLDIDGSGYTRLTNSAGIDTYPRWSPTGDRIAFLSMRPGTMGIFTMDPDGTDVELLYDSDSHDSDIDWVGEQIAFTRDSQIWLMNDDGSGARQVTSPPRAGEWGQANLPFGDYDPRLDATGTNVVFERLVDDASPHGNYDMFSLDLASGEVTALTTTGYSQGLAEWSHSGDQLVYVVAAIDGQGRFDIYTMNPDGSGNRNATPDYFPPGFLCHRALFTMDDTGILFIGEWYEE